MKQIFSLHPSWSFQDLYNVLMNDIEPELVTSSLPFLGLLYEGESAEQHAYRMQRYATAMHEFQRRLDTFMGAYKNKLQKVRSAILHGTKDSSAANDKVELDSLELSINV